MTAEHLSLPLQFLLVACAAFFVFGSTASFSGAWSLQAFVLMPPCSRADNSTRCCPTCLGVSHIEYGLYVAIPCLVSIAGVVGSGLLLDICGLSTAAVVLTSMSVLGDTLRAVATHLVFHHGVMLFLFILGEVFLESATYGLFVCREYIVNRYFEISRRPFVFSISAGIGNIGCVIAGKFIAPLAAKFGVPTAFWTFTGLATIDVVTAITLCFIIRYSAQIQKMDQEVLGEKQQRLSFSEAISNARSFQAQYWILFVAYPLAISTGLSFIANAVDYQTTLGAIIPVQAGINMASGFVAYILAAPVIGGVLWVTGPSVIIIAMLTASVAIGLSFMFVLPLLSVILTMAMHSSVIACSKTIYSFYVPVQSLGLAGSLLHAATLKDFALMGLTISAIEQFTPRKKGATIAVLVQCSVASVSVCLQLFLCCYYGNPGPSDQCGCFDRCQKDEEMEKQQILKEEQ